MIAAFGENTREQIGEEEKEIYLRGGETEKPRKRWKNSVEDSLRSRNAYIDGTEGAARQRNMENNDDIFELNMRGCTMQDVIYWRCGYASGII